MRKINKKYFTLPEVTMAIAILGIGLLSILGVFPVAIKSGLQAVKISESIHKARSAAHLWQSFVVKPAVVGGQDLPIESVAYTFAFGHITDNLKGVGFTSFIAAPVVPINPSILNGKFQMDKITMTVGTDFTTSFYVIKEK